MNLLILTLVSLAVSKTNTFTSTVFWHGMGDNCCSGISNLSATMESWYPGMKTHSIMIGSDEKADEKAGFFDKIARQVEEVCVKLKEIPDLQEGFNAIGELPYVKSHIILRILSRRLVFSRICTNVQ